MGKKSFWVYILASDFYGTLYVGITSDLVKRIWEHKSKAVKGFTEKYDVSRLVYFEKFEDPENAIQCEKRYKRYDRDWKINLIERTNPKWEDLYEKICT